jgi:N-dimethylarginine dimethylaminohydrolase
MVMRWSNLVPSFEGAGDALYLGDTLIGGYGFRSQRESYSNLTDVTVQLQDTRFYHLDTCFCPLKNNDYLIFPRSVYVSMIDTMLQNWAMSWLCQRKRLKFACNAVCLWAECDLACWLSPDNANFRIERLHAASVGNDGVH